MSDIMPHQLDWITDGQVRAESTKPICSCGWEGIAAPIDDPLALEKMRAQWGDHMAPHMPTSEDTLN